METGLQPKIIVRSELRSRTVGPDEVRSRMFNPSTRHPYIDAVQQSLNLACDLPSKPPELRIRLWIEDNGIGVPDESRGKIFGIFERGIGHETIEGTGIGLAIVARAMERMDGSYGVESEPGKGSRFWLEFPAADFSAPPHASFVPPQPTQP